MKRTLNTITVAELREMLTHYDDNMPVVFSHPSHDHWRTELAGGICNIMDCEVEWSDYHSHWKLADDRDNEEPDLDRVAALVIC